jgi:chromosome segregation ATPase
MFVDYIYLENWKNVKKALVELGKVNIFVGDNASGKSAFMSGIGYTLNFKSLETSQEDYKMWLEEYFRIYSQLRDKQNETIKLGTTFKKTASRILKIEGDPEIYTSSREINDKLRKRINSEISDWSSISTQGNSTAILDADNTESARKLKQIFGINQLTDVSESFKADISSIDNQIKNLKHEVDVLKEVYYVLKEIPILPNIESIKQQFNTLEVKLSKINEYKKLKESYDTALSNYENYIEKLNNLNKNKEDVELKISNLTEVKFNESEYSELYDKYLNLKNKKDNLEKAKKDYSEKVESINTTTALVSKTEKSLEDINKTISEIEFDESKLIQLENEILENRDSKTKIKLEISKLTNDLELAKKGECPTCLQSCDHLDVTEIESNITKHKEDLENLIKKQQDLIEDQKNLKDKQKIITDKKTEATSLESNLNIYKKNLLEKETELNKLDKPSDSIISEFDAIEKDLETAKELKKDYEAYLDKLKELNREQVLINNDLVKLNNNKLDKPEPLTVESDEDFDEELYKSLQKEINIYEEKEKQVAEIEAENKEIQLLIDQKNEKLARKSNEILLLQEELSQITETRRILDKQVTPFVISESQSVLIKKMNEFILPIFPQIELGIKEGTASFDFTFMDKKVGFPSKLKVASGFQRQAISLSYRVALTLISGVNLFLGDEIDSDSSVSNSLKLYKRLMQQNFDQYFIATHKKETIEMLVNEYDAKVFEVDDGNIYHNGVLLDGSNFNLKNMEIKK